MKKTITFSVVLLFYIFFQKCFSQPQGYYTSPQLDNLISGFTSEINADSIRSTIQSLQDFGTRYAMADNRKDIALWLKNKFVSYGFVDCKLDSFVSFEYSANTPTGLTQYNIVATIEGSEESDKEIVIGGHYDSYSYDVNVAPGADDNASGVAVALEISRILKLHNYKPIYTIKFVPFAAEEHMGSYFSGARYFADRALINNENILFMINNDMVSHCPDTTDWKVLFMASNGDVSYSYNFGWLNNITDSIRKNYTVLINKITGEKSDHVPFLTNCFTTLYFASAYDYWDYYHKPNDTVGIHNMTYCAEVAKISMGVILYANENPLPPRKTSTLPFTDKIKISWEAGANHNLKGYNVYRCDSVNTNITMLNSTLLTDTFFYDFAVIPNRIYYYMTTAVDSSNHESFFSESDSSRIYQKKNSILIVNDTKSDSVFAQQTKDFYHTACQNFNYDDYDISSMNNKISHIDMTDYNVVLWHGDKLSSISTYGPYDPYFSYKFNYELKQQHEIIKYLQTGGKMLYTSYSPVKTNMIGFYPITPLYGFLHDYLKINYAENAVDNWFNEAIPIASDYFSLHVDSLKTGISAAYHLQSIEAIYPTSSGNPIYSFGTYFNYLTDFGYFLGKPVGIEYLGSDYRTISLGFPLYYMNQVDAKNFIDYIMPNKFGLLASINENYFNDENISIRNYPNPFDQNTTFEISMKKPSDLVFEIFNIQGQMVDKLIVEKSNSNLPSLINWDASFFPAGVYYFVASSRTGKKFGKMIKY